MQKMGYKVYNPYFKLLVVLCISTIQVTSAQNDTIWYTTKWKKTTKSDATYYRPPVQKKGKLYEVKDYYIDHTLQMKGFSKYADKDHWEGLITWYDKNGQLSQSLEYTDNRLNGDTRSFYREKEMKGTYKDGRFVSGEVNMKANQYDFYIAKRDSLIVEIIHDNDLDGIRTETYLKDASKRYVVKRMFYDQQGKHIGTAIRDTLEYQDQGTDVYYYYDPMRVKQIIEVDKNNREVVATFYPNEQLRDQFIEEPKPKIVYYTEGGATMDSIYVKKEKGIRRFYDGKRIRFFSDYKKDELALIKSIEIYDKEGNLTEATSYFKNKQVRTKVVYKDKQKMSEISYDEKGNQIAELTYKNYLPWDGTKINPDRLEVFKEGKSIKEVTYYYGTRRPFKIFENNTATFYDQQGNQLSQVTSKNENYFSPFNGTSYAVNSNGKFTNISTYEKGVLTHEIRYQYFYKDSSKVGKEETFYDLVTRSRNRKIAYYHDIDQKRNETIFEGYDIAKELYYDRKGNLLGTFTPKTKDGLYIKYFYNSDQIQIYEERKNGEILKRKEYAITNRSGFKNSKYVLIEDTNIADKATYYSKQGEVIAQLKFKDGKPWQGQVYDHVSRELFSIKNGKKEGVYKQLDYNENVLRSGTYKNDQKEGEFVIYDKDGRKKEVKNYEAGKLEGKTVYYHPDGSIASALIYKADKPYEGKEIYQYRKGADRTERWYKNGTIEKEVITRADDIKKVYHSENNKKRVAIFFKDTERLKYSYTLDNGALGGEVIRYDKNGNSKYTAHFDNGKLESGTVLLKEDSYGVQPGNSLLLSKTENELAITVFDPKGAIVFELKENDNGRGQFVRSDKLGFDIRYIYETKLY
ncbi:hypothetical protein J8281_06795 [Aquimarina sp. U1-2]|uniref:toxin-antitoxin system YwqK family antitoxin n=1 Tax=Aquimarina sp. U1-2 TaxID=2823141 RepID=UPI001AECCDE1|nr:hypothetical protein [Aquimarina sp. U1-2]MBP2831892.1 hypothetical protein [Aquimarina sp. U1-2]